MDHCNIEKISPSIYKDKITYNVLINKINPLRERGLSSFNYYLTIAAVR